MAAFEIAPDSIIVRFRDASEYLYTIGSAGARIIAEMHRLAQSGSGLNGFINRHARKKYARRLR